MSAAMFFGSLSENAHRFECAPNAFRGDPADLEEGRFVVYGGPGAASALTSRVVGRLGDDWLMEDWSAAGPWASGWLYQVGRDGRVRKAWVAGNSERVWVEVRVGRAPMAFESGPEKPGETSISEQSKVVNAGSFACKRVRFTMSHAGEVFHSDSWYSKDVWRLRNHSEHGGLVAVEANGEVVTWLDEMGTDAKPTLPLPK
ncbi:MAG: hypothetical protein HYY17_02095 [Planctomycetes bacterium]|nr:hypothetical protein [Planctomycetota bacterium]